MKRIAYVLILVTLIAGLWIPSAMAKNDTPSVDVIILAKGSTNKLVKHIKGLGGTVNFQYRNVPAVAATIPIESFGEVASFSGVTSIEKDSMVYLEDEIELRTNPHPTSFAVEDMQGVSIQAIDPANIELEGIPEGYANFLYTGALSVWGVTMGEGTIVAVVDTGTVPNTCIGHAVTGAPDYADGYNATGDGIPATSPLNHLHGTLVGGVIASSCYLDFSSAPTHPIYLAQEPYLDWDVDFVPIVGQAPDAKLYPVKVFPASGAGVPSSVILDGLDHVLTLKLSGDLDIDIVNMSLGGPSLWDGRDVYDRFMEELTDAGILVVTSAGNGGPIPNSVGSPGTSFSVVSVGALDYAPSSRTFYEYLGLAIWPGTPGMGLVMRPTDELRVANYSSRGPLSDGRFGPEIAALGHWNFHEGPTGILWWATGTSFSSPTVAGAAALLNAYWENEGHETDPAILESVLFLGADPEVVDPIWRDVNFQGYGALDISASLGRLMNSDWKLKPAKKAGELEANMLGKPVKGKVQIWESETITLEPSESYDAVFEIGPYTSNVKIEVYAVDTPDNSAYAYWANALEVHLQSAKRTAFTHPVGLYWYPHLYGDSFDIVIEDGNWTFWGIPWDYMPMEPGLMKFTLIGDYSNEEPVSFQVRITRENGREPIHKKYRISNGEIGTDDYIFVPVQIPEGVSTATFDLTWHRDWSKFPTSDIDMIILDPSFAFASFEGVTGNSPERAVIETPTPGTWYVWLIGYELNKPDNYDLFLTLE
jgi:hypothetical protein